MAVMRAAWAAVGAARPHNGPLRRDGGRERRPADADARARGPAATTPRPDAPRRGVVGRPARVGVLGVAVAAMALCDLALTLEYLHAGAMWEHNPLARSVMASGSPAALVGLKALSLLPGAVLLTRYRAHRLAEMTAWCALAVMALVMLRWWLYTGIADELITAAGDPALAGTRHYVAWKP